MSDHSIAIVPKVLEYSENQQKAKEILEWLVSRDVVKPFLSDCILSTAKHGYAVSEGAAAVVEYPDELPFDLITNGLEIVMESQVFITGEFYDEEDEDFQDVESNLGFIFWNWPELKREFIAEFQTKLDCPVEVVYCHI